MFSFEFDDKLRKKLEKLSKKDKILVKNFRKKLLEIINKNNKSIDIYKNLKSPLNDYKRIHLTDNVILLFKVFKNENKIIFMDIIHWDRAYRK